MGSRIESRLAELGIVLPEPAVPVANYVPYVIEGSLAVLSGQLPFQDGKLLFSGKVGADVTMEHGQEAARRCFVNLLAQLRRAAGGDLDRVRRVIRLGGFIAAAPSFTHHASVMNGASDLAVAVFGEAGRHARVTVGVPSLPLDAPVEVEGMFALA